MSVFGPLEVAVMVAVMNPHQLRRPRVQLQTNQPMQAPVVEFVADSTMFRPKLQRNWSGERN